MAAIIFSNNHVLFKNTAAVCTTVIFMQAWILAASANHLDYKCRHIKVGICIWLRVALGRILIRRVGNTVC